MKLTIDQLIKRGKEMLWGILISLLCLSCSEEKESDSTIREEYKIAVVLPFNSEMTSELKEVINWALENLNASLKHKSGIRLTTEWIDESAVDLDQQFIKLADRDDISIILGPLYSKNVYSLASTCAARGVSRKALIPATASSENVMRTFSDTNMLWCLTENDISQCEVLMYRAKQKGAKKVSLLTSNEFYGQTFKDWFDFLALELGLEVGSVEVYEDSTSLQRNMERQLHEDTDCLICVPEKVEYAKVMNNVHRKLQDIRPFILYSDVAFMVTPNIESEGMEGVAQSHDPESGFGIAYEVRFNRVPTFGLAQYYDAAMLAGLAILIQDRTRGKEINECMKKVVSGDGIRTAWTREGIEQAIDCILSDGSPRIEGASGKLKFDNSVYTNVIHTVYSHWQVYQKKHLILEYNTSDDSERTDANIINWNRRGALKQEFDRNTSSDYFPKTGINALIISTSTTWENYRHQADAYAMYQLLLRKGISKENIILIAENDIAGNLQNCMPGEVWNSDTGGDVYSGVNIDYKISEIKMDDLSDIINGVQRADLPRVIHSGPGDNLFVYWVGHGEKSGLNWCKERVTAESVANLFKFSDKSNGFRQTFFALEACYGGCVGELMNSKGVLCMTSANATETSKSDNYSNKFNVWLSNSFSKELMAQMEQNRGASFYDAYLAIYNKTIGSHVSVYNAVNFDNLYNSNFNKFFAP